MQFALGSPIAYTSGGLTRIKGERRFIDEIPEGWPTRDADVPACDLLCEQITEMLEEGR